MDDISRALEPLLFPRGIPEDLDIPMVLSALADVLERDTEAADAHQSRAGGDNAAGAPSAASGRAPSRAALRPAQAQGRSETRGVPPPASGACGQREHTTQALRHLLLRMRGVLISVCGPQAPRLYALDGRIPEDPETLLLFARNAALALERAEPEDGRAAPFIMLDLAGAAACLREHTDALDMLLHAPEAGGMGPHPAERDEPPWDRRQRTVTSIAKALLRLADERSSTRSVLRHPRTSTTSGSSRPTAKRSAI